MWYVTFDERSKVDEFDGRIMDSKSVGLTLMFAACDRGDNCEPRGEG